MQTMTMCGGYPVMTELIHTHTHTTVQHLGLAEVESNELHLLALL